MPVETRGSASWSEPQRPWWWRWLGGLERITGRYEARAFTFLKSHLSTEQLDQFEREGTFDVVGGDTGQRYRILQGRIMNVQLLDANGSWRTCLCFEPCGHLPIGDVMLTQKFALELYETDALSAANKTSAYHSRRVSGRVR
jgi:hypothetical protein